ncbi:MAG: MerR family transcriptional regulator [Thermomicrobiales bacterium]
MGRRYRVGELARLAGVSVRTLHHYDQIGLLGPSGHSAGGRRLYEETDVLALQQILTLRYLGLPLKEIARLLRRPDFDLIASLRIQRRALRDRISELERIEAGVQRLVDSRLSTGAWDWDVVATAASTVQDGLTHRGAEMDAHYTPEQMAQFKELGEQVGPEAIRQIEEEWTSLIAEVRANRHLAPTDPAAQALADRWNAANERVAAAYRDYPELWQAIGENYQKGNFAASEHTPQPEDFAFIAKVNEARA